VVSVLVSLLFALRSTARSRAALHLEILALRHQLAVVNRSRRQRLRLTTADRVLWAWLSRVWMDWRPSLVLVTPATVLAWHRRGFRLLWTWKSRPRGGRPTAAANTRALIRQMAVANPLWGAPRIHGELLKLGVSVSQSTVAKYMPPRRHRPPSQSWRTFLANHAGQITAADFFVVPTLTYRLLFVLVILAHDRRRIVHVANGTSDRHSRGERVTPPLRALRGVDGGVEGLRHRLLLLSPSTVGRPQEHRRAAPDGRLDPSAANTQHGETTAINTSDSRIC
jgi:hypothetical protein